MRHSTLLLAARQAYAITHDGWVNNAPGCEKIGWLSQPRSLLAGDNAAIFGHTPEGSIIAFRGTMPLNTAAGLSNWLENLDSDLITEFDFPGKIDRGFVTAFNRFNLPGENEFETIYFTGHSLGGAIAQLASFILHPWVNECVTFASPRVGDANFAIELNEAVSVTCYENYGDIVPTLPPFNYITAGNPKFIVDGKFTVDLPADWQHAPWRAALQGHLLVKHSIDVGSDYAIALGV